MSGFAARVETWATRNNPLYSMEAFEEGRPFYGVGDWLQRMKLFSPHVPDLLSLLPFLVLVVVLWLVAREKIWAGDGRGAVVHR
jgi:hypothetical protein